MGKRNGEPWVNAGVKLLAQSIAEKSTDKFESGRGRSDAVAVGKDKVPSADFAFNERCVHHLNAEFVAKVVE